MKFGKVSLCLLLSLLLAFSGNYKTYAATMADDAIELSTFEIMPLDFKDGETKYFLLEITKPGTLNIEVQGARGGGWDKGYIYDLSGALIADKDVWNNVNFNVRLDKGSYYFRFDRADYYEGADITTLKIITTFTPDIQATIELKLMLSKGDTIQLGTLVNAKGEKITWKSSKKTIATVSSKGLVKAIKKGTTKIYAVLGSGKLTDITIEVK